MSTSGKSKALTTSRPGAIATTSGEWAEHRAARAYLAEFVRTALQLQAKHGDRIFVSADIAVIGAAVKRVFSAASADLGP